MIQMMALADAADKENRIASPASALTPLPTPKPASKPKRKKSANKARITADAWKADKVVQRMIKEKAMKDVTDLAHIFARHPSLPSGVLRNQQPAAQATSISLFLFVYNTRNNQ